MLGLPLLVLPAALAAPPAWEAHTITATVGGATPDCRHFTVEAYTGDECITAFWLRGMGDHRIGSTFLIHWEATGGEALITDQEFPHILDPDSTELAPLSSVVAGVAGGPGARVEIGASELRVTLGPTVDFDAVPESVQEHLLTNFDIEVTPVSRVRLGGRLYAAWDARIGDAVRVGPRLRVNLSGGVAMTWPESVESDPESRALAELYHTHRIYLAVEPSMAFEMGDRVAFHAELGIPRLTRASTDEATYLQLIEENYSFEQVDTDVSFLPTLDLGVRFVL